MKTIPKDINVFYASSQLYSYELAKNFKKHDNWNPVYWLVSNETKNLIKKEFPNALTHNYIDSVKGIPSEDLCNYKTLCIDPILLKQISFQYIIALYMMNRNDSHSYSFSFSERSEFFRKVLNYWFTVIKKLNIDLVVFEEEPHQASDYILYVLCGLLNIRTLMVVRTISNLGMLPVEKFEVGCVPLIKQYNSLVENFDYKNLQIDRSLELYFLKVTGDYDGIISEHLGDQIESIRVLSGSCNYKKITFNYVTNILTRLSNFKSHFIKLRILLKIDQFDSDQKQKGIRIEKSNLGYLQLFYYRIKSGFLKKQNFKIYHSLCTKNLDLKKPYIVCGLQYQPEKSTCPLGGHFVDQTFMVELISFCLPKGWQIFVKEHPSQFVSNYRRYGECRDRHFYENLIKIPNVQLVPLNVDSFTLIDNSHAVASVGGTICWEAISRGKPALCFGRTWYKDCHGVFDVSSVENLQAALKEIINGYQVHIGKVILFAKLIHSIGFNGAVGGGRKLKEKKLTPQKNAEIHYSVFKSYFENNLF